MITRLQFFKDALASLGRAVAGIWPEDPDRRPASAREPFADPSFTELGPSLLAMEAERSNASHSQIVDLRRELYAQLAERG